MEYRGYGYCCTCLRLISINRYIKVAIHCIFQTGPKHFTYQGHAYFFSGHEPQYENKTYDWLDARNLCRDHCMDAINIEFEVENDIIIRLMKENNITGFWTSGRLCDFDGCENRTDLIPKNIFGWFWSGNRAKIHPTNKLPEGWTYNPWSRTGHKKKPQPDNAEYDVNMTSEACMAVLNNAYEDGVKWHDVACYHSKPVLCEDNEDLLGYTKATSKNVIID